MPTCKTYKLLLLAFPFLLLSNCSVLQKTKNTSQAINQLKFTETIYELVINEDITTIDTISIERIKRDKKKRKRYSTKQYFFPNERMLNYENYYDNQKEVFKRIVKDSEAVLDSEFQAFYNDKNLITKAIQVNASDRQSKDTVHMTYDYAYHTNGKLKQKEIKAMLNDTDVRITRTLYDKNENELQQLVLQNKDTLSIETSKYQASRLEKSILFQNINGLKMKSVFYFNPQKKCTKIEEFYFDEVYVKVSETKIAYNEKSEKMSQDEFDVETQETRRIQYVHVKH